MRPRIIIFALILVSAVLSGCQGNPVTPDAATPDSAVTPDIQSTDSNHYLLGYSTIIIDTGSMNVEILPIRTADLHLNLTGVFNTSMGLAVAPQPSLSDPSSGFFVLDITLTHPFPGKPVLTAFDVKGILITPGTYAVASHTYAGPGETILVNADAYTRWWNYYEFWDPGFFGYTEGNLSNAMPIELTATLNPYKLFADALGKTSPLDKLLDIPLDNPAGRGVFTAGASNTRRYEIQFPLNPGPVVKFGYAIDACWKPPAQVPPVEIPDDFPYDANQPEVWRVAMEPVINYLYYDSDTGDRGGFLKLRFEVNDWQAMGGLGTYDDEVFRFEVIAPEIASGNLYGYFYEEENQTGIFYASGTGLYPTHTGPTLIMCRVKTPNSTKYPQDMQYAAPNERIAHFQPFILNVVDPECVADDNNDFSEAVEISLTEDITDQVCLPDDEADFYTFEIPAGYELDGNIRLSCNLGPTTIEIYDSEFKLVLMKEVTIDDHSPYFSFYGPDSALHPGKYYIRVHAFDISHIAPYWLSTSFELEPYSTHLTLADTDELFFIPKDIYIPDDYNSYIVSIGDPGLNLYYLSYYDSVTLSKSVDIPDVTDSTFRLPFLYFTQDKGIDEDHIGLVDITSYSDPVLYDSVIESDVNIADIAINSTDLILATDEGAVSSVDFYDYSSAPAVPVLSESHDFDSPSHIEIFDPDGSDTHLLITSATDPYTIESYGVESTVPWEFSGSFTAFNPIIDFTSQGDYIYVLDSDGSACNLTILHHDAGNLVVDSSLPFSGSYNNLSVKGNYVYITGHSRIKVINILHPDAPAAVSDLPLAGTGTNMAFKGNLGCLVIENGGFEVYDLTYPPLPALVARLEVINNPVSLFNSQGITHYFSDTDYDNYHMVKRLYYDSDYYSPGWYITNIQPVLFPFAKMINDPPYTIASSPDNLAYFIENIDGYYSDFGPYEFTGNVTALGLTDYIDATSSHFFYIAEEGGNLNIGDIGSDYPPEFLSVMPLPYNINEILIDESSNSDLVDERRMYAISDIGTVEIFNLDDPSDPQQMGTYTPAAAPLGMTVAHKYLYLACGPVFEIIYIGDSALPEFKGSVALPGDYAHVAIDGQYAYLAGSPASNSAPIKCSIWPPDNPNVLETVPDWTYGGCNGMAKNYTGPLYLATDRGVRVIKLY